MTIKCPCCSSGFILDTNICDRCGVAMSRGALVPDAPRRTQQRKWAKRQDQDSVSPMADAARYKEDHQ